MMSSVFAIITASFCVTTQNAVRCLLSSADSDSGWSEYTEYCKPDPLYPTDDKMGVCLS